MNRAAVLRQLRSIRRDVTVNTVLSSTVWPGRVRTMALRRLGYGDIHPSATIFPGVFLGSEKLAMGPRSVISYGCFLDLGAQVTLGTDSGLSYQCMLITCSHKVGPEGQRFGEPIGEPITIGDGCWIGARVTILPGVTIGDGCIVAAGSTISRDLAPNGLYAGNPARRLRDLPVVEPGAAVPVP